MYCSSRSFCQIFLFSFIHSFFLSFKSSQVALNLPAQLLWRIGLCKNKNIVDAEGVFYPI